MCRLFYLWRRHIVLEPLNNALEEIAPMLRISKAVPFARINHELRLDAQRVQRVPELVRLWHRALPVALAHRNQRRRFHILDERDRGASRVYRRIIIDRRAEVRQHPLVDGVFAIIAFEIGDARARECRPESRWSPSPSN